MSPSRPTTRQPAGTLAFVGAGGGDPGLLAVRAAALLAAADLVIHDPDVSVDVLAGCRPDADRVPVSGPPAERAKRLAAGVKAGRAVVRLVVGDPLGFGGAADEVEACAKANVGFDVVPAVSPALGVAAYAGIAVPGGRRRPADVRMVDLAGPGQPRWDALATDPTLVLSGRVERLVVAGEALVEHGMPVDRLVSVTVSGATVRQQTILTTLGRLEATLAGARFDARASAVAVVGEVVASRDRLSWWETKPLFGWQVLVPRTREQAGALSERLRAAGAVPVEVPTIAVEPPRTPAAMDRAVKGLVSGRYLWVAFTSTNAVRAMREKFESVGLDVRAFAGIRVAAIGEQTASALQMWGIQPELRTPADRQSSEGLLDVWPAYDDVFDPIDRVLLPRADIATETLVAGLQARGWQVDDVTAYRTVRAAPPPAEIRDAIKGGGFDAVLFTSSSTVRNLVGIAGKPHTSTVIAVIGPQTARTAEELGLRVDVLAPEASVVALAVALADYGRDRRLTGEPPRPAGRAARSAAKAKPARAR